MIKTYAKKEIINIETHHISFNIAKQVFNDMNRIEIYDIQCSLEQDHYNTIGMVEDVLFVVHTEKRDSPELTPEMEKAFRLAAKTRNRLRA